MEEAPLSLTSRRVLLLLSGTALLLAVACGAPGTPIGPSPFASPSPLPSPKVAILSVDGLRPDALRAAGAPNILALARRGAYTWKAQTVFPSVTLTAHSSMLSGVGPLEHGMTWDEWKPGRGCIPVPTVFGVAKAAGSRTVVVAGKDKFQHLNVPGTIDSFVLTGQGDADVANRAIVEVQAGFDLLFVHFPDTDLSGHSSSWLSGAYLTHVGEADRAIGRLVEALPAETTVILTADHGGQGHNHGSNDAVDMTIPWVIAGPRIVARGRELQFPVRITDTTVTALYLLGVSPPPGVTGKVVSEAFSLQ